MSTHTIEQSDKTFTSATHMSPLVNEVLQQDSFYHPNLGGVTKGGMSNHYPMTILSLQGLGASDEEIQRFSNMWPRQRAHVSQHLNLTDNQSVNEHNWQDYLGEANYLLEFRRVFLTGLQKHDNSKQYITHILYVMRNGLPMGLFHPLIRISFAMIHGDAGLIADGLAYMAIRFNDLYKGSEFSGTTAIKDENRLEKNASEAWQSVHTFIQAEGKGISFKQTIQGGSLHIGEQLCSEPAIHSLAFDHGMNITQANILQKVAEISMCALRLYLHQPALTTLHAVTACQALADITKRSMPNIDEESLNELVALWERYWVWLTGMYIEKGYPKQLPLIDKTLENEIAHKDWQDLALEARNILEVHLIKMVYSCKWFFENIEESVYYKLAVVKILKERNAHPRTHYGLEK